MVAQLPGWTANELYMNCLQCWIGCPAQTRQTEGTCTSSTLSVAEGLLAGLLPKLNLKRVASLDIPQQ